MLGLKIPEIGVTLTPYNKRMRMVCLNQTHITLEHVRRKSYPCFNMAYIIRGQQEKFKKFVYLRGN